MSENIFAISSKALAESVAKTLSQIDSRSVDLVKETILSSKRVFVYGVGRSGLVGKAFAMRLVQMDIESYFIGETITPIVKAGDGIIVLSNTGETMSAIQTANIARREGANVVAVTASPTSKLAHAANIILEIPIKNGKPDPLAPLGTKFEDASLLALDSLIIMLMKAKGETEESMRQRHAINV